MTSSNVTNVVSTPYTLNKILEEAPNNLMIQDALTKSYSVLKKKKYEKICISISGGSDSDVLLDIASKFSFPQKEISVVFFDTGLEYKATKEHIDEIEKKYNIKVERFRPKKPIPLTVKEYGQPFLSKQISEFCYRLQNLEGWKWENIPYEECLEKYCYKATEEETAILNEKAKIGKKTQIGKRVFAKRNGYYYAGQVSAIDWWCNAKGVDNSGGNSHFNISQRKFLKEYMIENPPQFKIAAKCCTYAKKNVSSEIQKQRHFDLMLTGIRRSEGGVRSVAYHGCYSMNDKGVDQYRPLFWMSNKDKQEYNKHYCIKNSRCYTEYALKRTGCVCCPCSRNFEHELEVVKEKEPNLYKACQTIFRDSYEYTRGYIKFKEQKKRQAACNKWVQMTMFDFL